jgi:hypothetical protein
MSEIYSVEFIARYGDDVARHGGADEKQKQ